MKSKIIRLYRNIILIIANVPLISGQKRYLLCKMGGGVNIKGQKGFIGKDVKFDTIHPELVTIEDGAYITEGTYILTHYLNADNFYMAAGWWRYGKVHIGKNAFIGAHTIICNSVSIGEHSIIGAGSVVTKDIPPYEIWGGNPAHFIRKRTSSDNV